MSTVVKKTRSDDLIRLKPHALQLAGISDPEGILKDRTKRGWNSIDCARMLCPITDIDQFEQDPAA